MARCGVEGAMIIAALRLLALTLGAQIGMGTVFGSSTWDRWNPNSTLACLNREIDDLRDEVVALPRHIPCGARVWLYNPANGRSAVATVADRGPRRALVDMSLRVARKLGHSGRAIVIMAVLP